MLKFIRHAWLLLPCLPYLWTAAHYASNVPIMDDYEMILRTILDWNHADFFGKIRVLFAQYNEHRIVFPRLVYVTYYSLFGDINFKNLILLANAQLLVVAFVGVYFIRRLRVYWKLFAFIWMLLVFDLNSYENGSIASYGMQNWSVLMWVFLAFYFYSRPGKWWVAACVAQFIAVFCSGNGMIAGPFLILCFPKYRAPAVISFISSISIYFLCGYEFVNQPDQSYNLLTMAEYFVREIGAPANFGWSGALFGIGLLVFMATRVADKFFWCYDDCRPVWGIVGFAMASIIEATVFRSGLPNAQFQTSRYLIYPEMVWALMFMLMPFQKRTNKAILLVSVLLFFGLDFEFGKLGFERAGLKASIFKYYHPNPIEAARIAKEACEENVYCIDDNR